MAAEIKELGIKAIPLFPAEADLEFQIDFELGEDDEVNPEFYKILQEGIELDESIERLEGSIETDKAINLQ